MNRSTPEENPQERRPLRAFLFPLRASSFRDWRVLAGAVVVLVLAVFLVRGLQTRLSYAALLRSEPDAEAADPTLAKFAAAQAKPLYAKNCASCHGADMQGDTAKGIPNLADADWLYGSGRVAEIEKTVLYGIRSGDPKAWNLADMPAFGEAEPYRRYRVQPLRPQDIRDVIAYIRFVADKPADVEAAKRGAKIFDDTGQCYDCHANDSRGDSAIGAPNLIDDIWLYGDGSPDSVFRSVAHGHAGVCPAWTRRLKAGQVRALAVYIHNNAKPAKPVQAVAATQAQGKPS